MNCYSDDLERLLTLCDYSHQQWQDRYPEGRLEGALMLDHTGQRRVRYEDAFRALGNYLDQSKFTQISIVETPEGFLLKGYAVSEDVGGYHVIPTTYLFTNEDVDAILESSYGRRRRN